MKTSPTENAASAPATTGVWSARELAALVDEARDRLGQHRGDEPGGDQQEADLAYAGVDGPAETGHVAPRGEAGERREEHGRDGDGEDPLREHVQAEREVDRRAARAPGR